MLCWRIRHPALSWSLAQRSGLISPCNVCMGAFYPFLNRPKSFPRRTPALAAPRLQHCLLRRSKVHATASFRSQLKRHLLREAFPDHPGQRSLPVSLHPASLSSITHITIGLSSSFISSFAARPLSVSQNTLEHQCLVCLVIYSSIPVHRLVPSAE